MDDPRVHLPVNTLWTDKWDLSLKLLKISAQSVLLTDFWFPWLAVRKDTRPMYFSLHYSALFSPAETQAKNSKNISHPKYPIHGLSTAANQTPACGQHRSKRSVHSLKPIQFLHTDLGAIKSCLSNLATCLCLCLYIQNMNTHYWL